MTLVVALRKIEREREREIVGETNKQNAANELGYRKKETRPLNARAERV